MATENHPGWPKIAAGLAGVFITSVIINRFALYTVGVFTGRPSFRFGNILGTAAALSGLLSVGATAIGDARNQTAATAGTYIRRAMLSAATISAISFPILYGAERLIGQLLRKEKNTEKCSLRNYAPAVVVCCGITHLPNRFLLYVLKFGTLVKVSRKRREKNTLIRSEILPRLRELTAAGYLEAQPAWGPIPFGAAVMSYSGCEIIAVYNALHALGKYLTPQELAELIATFERKGAVLQGLWGCSPYALYDYFVKCGYPTELICSRDPKVIDQMGERFEVLLLTAYNDRYDIRSMIHTICLEKEKNGCYRMHNSYHKDAAGAYAAYDGDGQIRSFDKVLTHMSSGGHASPLCVIGISRPD